MDGQLQPILLLLNLKGYDYMLIWELKELSLLKKKSVGL